MTLGGFISALIGAYVLFVCCMCGGLTLVVNLVRDKLLRQTTIARPIAVSLLSPTMGADWSFSGGSRMDAKNAATGVSVWGYSFNRSAHLYYGSAEIELEKWEQRILNSALRKRNKITHGELRCTSRAANDDRIVAAAEALAATYEKRS